MLNDIVSDGIMLNDTFPRESSLPAMYRMNMIVQLILPRERAVTCSFTAWAPFVNAPVHRRLRAVSPVVVTFEVRQASKGLVAACELFALEKMCLVISVVVH